MKAGSALTAAGVYSSVAESVGLKPKEVKGAVEGLVSLAAQQLKKNGNFKIGNVLNLKLKSKPATPARKGVNPFTKEPCVFKAKPASKTVRALPMKKTQGVGELMLCVLCGLCLESILELLSGHGGRS